MNKGIWEEGRELFRTELGRVEMIEGKVQEIWGKFGTRVRENGKDRESRGERGRRKGWWDEEEKKRG